MKIGTKVIISDRSKEYQGKYVNEIGVIKRGNCFSEGLGKVGVELDNYPNYRSGYSVFWFEESVLDIYESEDECVMLNGYKLAGVSFVDGRNQDTIYTYAMYDEELAVGDKVRIISAEENDVTRNWNSKMEKYLGTVMTIKHVYKDGYRMEEDDSEWFWDTFRIAGKVE